MTIQELIDRLNQIENKNLPVRLSTYSYEWRFWEGWEITGMEIVTTEIYDKDTDDLKDWFGLEITGTP